MRRAEEAFVGTARFHVRGRLGDGGGGVVYRAHDRLLGRDVALKVMRDAQGDGVTRFRRSFPTLARLSHPNLVQLLELLEDDGRWLLVMELVEGSDLLTYVRHGGARFDELRLRAVLSQLAQGLYALHAERKVHRDVKPSNVRVTPEGRVVLVDLDLSLDLDAEQGDGWAQDARPVGTAHYMAPEQASLERLSFASDWYSFGVVLYEALTGAPPYRGTDLEILLKKQDTAPPAVEELVPDAPRDLAALCADLLVPQPSARPSGAEVLKRLGVEQCGGLHALSLASLLSARPAFVGREHEMERLMSALERSRQRPYVVRVTGEPGVGKTTLCEELFRRLARDAAATLTLSSVCPRYPDRPHLPLCEPVSQLVDAMSSVPAAQRPSLGAGTLGLLERMFGTRVLELEARGPGSSIPPDPLEQRFRALEALRSLFVALCSLRPVVLWLDSYQWADVDTQRLIGGLLRGEDAPRMLVVLSEDLEPEQLPSSQPSADEVIALTGLTPQAARSLTAQLTQHGPSAGLGFGYLRDALPLMIHERVRYALTFGSAPSDEQSLFASIDARVAALPAEARAVLELVCAAYDALPQDVIERASGLSRAAFSRQLALLRLAHLVRSFSQAGEDHLAPAHLVVAVALERRVQEARPQLHATLLSAQLAREAGRSSARLLRHQGESGDLRGAALSAQAAAQEAERALSFQRAAELLSFAVSVQPAADDVAGVQLLARLGDALSNAGWSLSAAAAYREAGQLAKAAQAIHMRQRAVEHYLRAAEHDVALRAMRELLASFDVQIADSARVAFWHVVARRTQLKLRGLGFRELSEGQVSASDLREVDALWSVGIRLAMIDLMRGGDIMARALLEALRVGEPQRVARALCTEAWTVLGYKRTHLQRMANILASARNLAERQPSPLLEGHLKLTEGMLAIAEFELPVCFARFRDAERVFRDGCAGVSWEIAISQVYQLVALSLMARFREASRKYDVWLREAEERGDAFGLSLLKCVGAVATKLPADLPNEGAEDVRQSVLRWPDDRELPVQLVFSLVSAAYVDLYRGLPRCLDSLEHKWPTARRQFFLDVRFSRSTLLELRGRARVLAGKRRKDAALLRAAESDASTLLAHGERPERGLAQLLLANVQLVRGDQARAIELLQAGIGDLSPSGLDLWTLPARYVLGALTAQEGGLALQQRASEQLREGGAVNVTRYVQMMMTGWDE